MATSRSARSGALDRPDSRVPAGITKLLLRLLGGACVLVGAFTLLAGYCAVWIYGSLIFCGLLLLATAPALNERRNQKRSSLPAGQSDPELMSPSDLSSMTPPGWDAVPPTVGMAAQPDSYFHNRRDSR